MNKTIAAVEEERKQGNALVFGKSVKIEQKLEELEGVSPATIRTTIPFQLKSLNDEERTIEFVGSTKAKDRYGDVIEQAGWEIGNFLGNPVVPWGHDYSMPPVAKALEVGIKDGDLVFKAQFATKDEYEWADTIYKLYKGGYLRAFSVGFIPLEYDGNWEVGYTFTKCELLEVSCVTVPANPEALVLAYKEGTLSDSERKSYLAQADSIKKALTLSADEPQNEDMETANALKELSDNIKALTNLLTIKSEDAAEVPANDQTEDEVTPAPSDEPAGSANPAPEAAGGTEDEGGEQDADVLANVSPEELKSIIGEAVKDKLDYQLGKIK